MPAEKIENYADVLKKYPDLAKDGEWLKTHAHLEYWLSDQGRADPNNPLAEYLDESFARAKQRGFAAAARDTKLVEMGGAFFHRGADGTTLTPATQAELQTISERGLQYADEKMVGLKERIIANAALGYKKEDPIPAGNFLEAGASGAIDQVTSLNFGGIVGGFMSGVGSAVKDFIFNIPIVGQFMSQLNNWVGSNLGAMFSKDKKALTWDEAGKMAVAQSNARHVANGLAVFTDMKVDAVTSQLEHNLTFNVSPPEITETPATTAPSSPSTATTPEPTPAEPTPTEPQASEPSTEKKTPAFKPMAQILQNNKIDAEEFSQMLQARGDGPPANSLPNVQQLLENPNVVVMRLGDDANAPVAFGTKGENGSISEVHVVRDGKVYQYAQTFNGESEFLSSGEFLKDPVAGKESAFFTQVQDVGTVGYDEIAAEITQYVAKEKDLIASR